MKLDGCPLTVEELTSRDICLLFLAKVKAQTAKDAAEVLRLARNHAGKSKIAAAEKRLQKGKSLQQAIYQQMQKTPA